MGGRCLEQACASPSSLCLGKRNELESDRRCPPTFRVRAFGWEGSPDSDIVPEKTGAVLLLMYRVQNQLCVGGKRTERGTAVRYRSRQSN